jgi:predicted N-acetyltransferase YhbS
VNDQSVISAERPATVTPSPARIVVEQPEHSAAFDRLLERAFGPGRLAKASQRLREGNTPLADLCFMAVEGERLVGGVRLWPVQLAGRQIAFLGPIAVDPDFRSHGVGGDLITHACNAAQAAGQAAVLLVGDRPFFEPLGFQVVPKGQVSLPGPADPMRILWRELTPGGLDGLSGAVSVR